jgi:hypothetical protein
MMIALGFFDEFQFRVIENSARSKPLAIWKRGEGGKGGLRAVFLLEQ